MKSYLLSVLTESSSFSFQDTVLHIAAAAIISAAIYLSYWYTHPGTSRSKKFNVSLITLTILTATAITVIGSSVALALGMIGALSIVRFRTCVNDSRDATYVFWAIIAGICCGVGDYAVAAVGSAAVFLVLLLLGRVRSENTILLIIRGTKSRCLDMEGLVFDFFNGKAMLKVKNTTADTAELIFEMPRSAYQVSYQRDHDITEKLYALGGVEHVNIVIQSDEIDR